MNVFSLVETHRLAFVALGAGFTPLTLVVALLLALAARVASALAAVLLIALAAQVAILAVRLATFGLVRPRFATRHLHKMAVTRLVGPWAAAWVH